MLISNMQICLGNQMRLKKVLNKNGYQKKIKRPKNIVVLARIFVRSIFHPRFITPFLKKA
jgi:hypothetical protein